MKKETIIALLEGNDSLRSFVVTFHKHLTDINPGRYLSPHRSSHEKALDSMGRLLVGDEVCAAVALDKKWLVSTNKSGHVTSDIAIYMGKKEIQVDRNSLKVKIKINYHFVLTTNSQEKTEIIKTEERLWRYDNKKHQLIPRDKKLSLTIYPWDHDIEEYDDIIKLESTLLPIPLDKNISIIPDSYLELDLPRQNLLSRMPIDSLQLRSGSLFFHMMQVANYIKRGNKYTMENGGIGRRYATILSHRVRLMLQTFYSNAASWYPVFKKKSKRAGFNLDACKPTSTSRDIFLALLPDNAIDEIAKDPTGNAKNDAIVRVRKYAKKLFTDGLEEMKIFSGERRKEEIKKWLEKSQETAEKNRTGIPSDIFEGRSARFFFLRFERYFIANDKLNELQNYIKTLSNKLNATLRMNPKEKPEEIIKKWTEDKKIFLKLNVESEENFPSFMREKADCSLDDFFDRFSRYFLDILRIEDYIAYKAKSAHKDDISFIKKLLDLDSYENISCPCLFVPKVIDELAEGSHAEIRLFYYITQVLKNPIKDIPYFGITQLCCATCSAFLSGHGLNPESGERSIQHAGKHGKHYPGWVLDDRICSEGNMKALLGAAWEKYAALSGDYTFGEKTQTLQAWARLIIQELGVLDKSLMEKFEMSGEPLFPRGSNYADEDFETPSESPENRIDTSVAEVQDFLPPEPNRDVNVPVPAPP